MPSDAMASGTREKNLAVYLALAVLHAEEGTRVYWNLGARRNKSGATGCQVGVRRRRSEEDMLRVVRSAEKDVFCDVVRSVDLEEPGDVAD